MLFSTITIITIVTTTTKITTTIITKITVTIISIMAEVKRRVGLSCVEEGCNSPPYHCQGVDGDDEYDDDGDVYQGVPPPWHLWGRLSSTDTTQVTL